MRRHLLLGLVAVPGLALATSLGAQARPAPAGGEAAALPSVTLPPALDRVLRDYERTWQAGDVAALAALFAEDGFVLQNGRQPVRGRAAIQAAYAGQAGGALRLRAYAYATGDTVGYIVGGYTYGDAPSDMGKFSLTLKRARAGRWLIFSDMDNASQPPRRPGGSPAPAPSPTPPAER